jgi:hypothetical protein
MRRSSQGSITPLTHTYPQAKPMEFAGSKRKPPRADLRVRPQPPLVLSLAALAPSSCSSCRSASCWADARRCCRRNRAQEQVLKRETKRQHSQVLTELGAATNLSQEAMHLLEVQNVETAMCVRAGGKQA